MSMGSLMETYRTLSDIELDFVERQLILGTGQTNVHERLYALDKIRKEREENNKNF